MPEKKREVAASPICGHRRPATSSASNGWIAMLASIQIAEHKERPAVTFRRETKVFENGIQVNKLSYLMTLVESLRRAAAFH